MKAVRWIFSCVLVFSTATVLGVMPVFAQVGDPPSVSSEGDCRVYKEFEDYVENHGGEEIFGYPISNPFWQGGVLVQYFQNARIESHPNNPPRYQVQLGLLGDELSYRDDPITRPRFLHARRHFFPETGHIVSYAFLDYFKKHGGIDLFGYPITEMHYDDGRIIQYFQRLKLSWHPEDTRSPVHVGNLGEIYFDTYKDNFPDEAFCGETSEPTDLRVMSQEIDLTVDVKYPVMTKEVEQIVSVLVRDEDGNEMSGIEVRIALKDQAGRTLSAVKGVSTNDRGFAQVSLPVENVDRGENVAVEAVVTYGGRETAKEIVFLVWW